MLGRWFRESLLVCAFAGPPPLPTVEQWSVHNSKKASPDQLISGAIVKSIAAHFDDWKVSSKDYYSSTLRPKTCHSGSPREVTTMLANTKKECKVVFTWEKEYHSYDYDYKLSGCKVNNVDIEFEQGKLILESYEKVKEHIDAVNAAAAEAKRKMEENEKKWNVAEHLLNMKRNEHGALVPKETVE